MLRFPRILLSSSPTALEAALAAVEGNTATVEAEFGDTLVSGRGGPTLAHHGPRSGNPCPCLHTEASPVPLAAIGLSHVDLDALGGILALLGRKPSHHMAQAFWKAAAHVDINGPHRLDGAGVSLTTREHLHAFWAWSEKNRLYAPRDGSVIDASQWVADAEAVLGKILEPSEHAPGRADLMLAGVLFEAAGEALNKASLIRTVREGGVAVLLRSHAAFVNHLYAANGGVADAVVAFNDKTGSVTVSLERARQGVSCRAVVQRLWGPEAGGHDGVAGSPRDRVMTMEDTDAAVLAMITAMAP